LGAVGVLKQLDHFLVVRGLLGSVVNFRSWIGTSGRSEHNPFFLELLKAEEKPSTPFKFNLIWLEEE
jgi:hypothetical protein